jgi:hypothetical protein
MAVRSLNGIDLYCFDMCIGLCHMETLEMLIFAFLKMVACDRVVLTFVLPLIHMQTSFQKCI